MSQKYKRGYIPKKDKDICSTKQYSLQDLLTQENSLISYVKIA